MSGRARRPGVSTIVTALAIALAALWLAVTLTWPFGWDHGIFAWVGSVIRDGGMPYRDAADIKGPLVYSIYAAAQAIFGDGTWGIHVVDGAFMVAGAFALRSIVQRFAPSPAGTWAGCALLLWIGSLGFWSSAQPDGWTGLFMAAAVALLFRNDEGATTRAAIIRVIAAAALAGTTALVKPFYMAFVLLPIVWVWLRHAGNRRAGLVSLAVLAAALPVAVAAGWLALNGALADAIDVHLRFTAGSYSGVADLNLVGRVRGLLDFATRVPVLLFVLPAVAVGMHAGWRTDRDRTIIIVAWAALALGFIILQNRYYLYHATALFPPLVVLAAIGFRAAIAPDGGDAGRARLPAAATLRLFGLAHLTLVALLLLQVPLLDIRRAARYVTGVIDAQVYYRHFAPMMSYNAADEQAMVRTLRERSTPADRVAILGYNAGILYLAGRAAVSRFGASIPWTLDTGAPIARRFRREIADSIERARPRWIVVGAIDGAPRSIQNRLREHGEIGQLVEQRYCLAEQIGHYALFRLCEER